MGLKRWKNYFFSLESDGTMTRYRDSQERRKDNMITQRASVDLLNSSILVGDDVIGLDDRPPMNLWMDGNLMMCIPVSQTETWWLHFHDYCQLG